MKNTNVLSTVNGISYFMVPHKSSEIYLTGMHTYTYSLRIIGCKVKI